MGWMNRMRQWKRAFGALAMSLLVAFPATAHAGWPSVDDVLKIVGPIMGLNPNQIEAAKFAVKHPSCALTITTYTMEQDYSILAFIIGLKTTKIQSIPGMPPQMSASSCKGYNPVQRAYQFIDSVGDDVLGKKTADFFRKMLAEQISQGKSSVDSEIAAIPYVGTVLSNWDCECDGAFDSNFPLETMVNDKVGSLLKILNYVKDGSYGSALEELITAIGPELACELGAQWTGAGSIPVVSDIATAACSSIAGKVVGWVIEGASDVGQALGIIGGDHMDPELYYKQSYGPYIGKDDYQQNRTWLYQHCYGYFEPTNMAASTAKKVCTIFDGRYVDDSIGRIQWNQMESERSQYYNSAMKPKAFQGALLVDADFDKLREQTRDECVAYFTQKYPKMNAYAKNYGGDTIETECNDFAGYNVQLKEKYGMWSDRAKVQATLISNSLSKLSPFCQKGERNSVKCDSGQPLDSCKIIFPAACVKDMASGKGGMQAPCCVQGDGQPESYKQQGQTAANLAKKVGDPYCFTTKTDPLRISCTIEGAFKQCQKQFSWADEQDCSKGITNSYGGATKICCSYDPGLVDQVPGVTKVKSFVAQQNVKAPGSCYAGGSFNTLSYDIRVANCGTDALVKTCKATLGSAECKKLPSGFVSGTCCELAPFGGEQKKPEPYDPAKRSKDDLALTAKIIAASQGQCEYAKGPDGKPDLFHVVCKSFAASKMCVQTMGRPALTSCKAKLSDNGWEQEPCCEVSPEALTADGKPKPEPNKKVDVVGLRKILAKSIAANLADHPKPPKDGTLDKKKALEAAKGLTVAPAESKSSSPSATAKPTVKTPLSQQKPAVKTLPKRKESTAVPGLVSIRLVSARAKSGINPFSPKDVAKKVDPNAAHPPTTNGTTAPAATPGTSPASTPGATNPAAAPNAVAPATAPPGVVAPTGAVNRVNAPSTSFCAGKSDGDYCGTGANNSTLYTCANGMVQTTFACEFGCNSALNHCSK